MPYFSYSSIQTSSETGSSVGNFPLVIRNAMTQDIKSLTEVLTDSFHSSEGLMTWIAPVLKLGIYEDLRSRLNNQSPNYLCLVATIANQLSDRDEVIGTVELSLRSNCFWLGQSSNHNYPYISNLAVAPAYRRQGVACKLLLCCEQTALNWGFNRIALHVLENNYQAQELYFNHGYQLHRIESMFVDCLFNRPRRLFLNKHISNREQ